MALAAEYPHDVGIEADSSVILVERFQDSVASIATRLTGDGTISTGYVNGSRGQSRNTSGMSVPTDAPALSNGTTCLQMTASSATTSSGSLYTNLATINPAGYDELYFRVYVKYLAGGTRHHNGLWILGQNPSSNFLPGTTGQPNGADWFHTGIEPEHPVNTLGVSAYTAWMEMHPLADGITYISNTFDEGVFVAGQWHCVECRIKMNTPTSSRNGELQFWLDDVQIFNLTLGSPLGSWSQNQWTTGAGSTPFEGFRWRSTTSLNLNGVWLNHLADLSASLNTMRWAHLVVATERIGALAAGVSVPSETGVYAVTGGDMTGRYQAIQAWLRIQR